MVNMYADSGHPHVILCYRARFLYAARGCTGKTIFVRPRRIFFDRQSIISEIKLIKYIGIYNGESTHCKIGNKNLNFPSDRTIKIDLKTLYTVLLSICGPKSMCFVILNCTM